MLTRAEAISACMSLGNCFEDYPFDDDNWTAIRHKGNNKVFAFVFERNDKIYINLKAEPLCAQVWCEAYTSVIPAYHMNKRHWISVILDGSIDDANVLPLITDSYALTSPKVDKK